MKQENLNGPPADLASYEAFVRQTLVDNQKRGGVAMKFEAAYFRTLYFRDPLREKTEAIYASSAPAARLPKRTIVHFRITFFAC